MTDEKPFDAVAYATEKLGPPSARSVRLGGPAWYGRGIALVLYVADGSLKMNYRNNHTGSNGTACTHPGFIRNAIDDAAAHWPKKEIDMPQKPPAEPTPDNVNSPAHYTQGGVETIDAISSAVAGYTGAAAYCAGNVCKYIARGPFKGSHIEDLRKASWYLDRLIKEVEGNQ